MVEWMGVAALLDPRPGGALRIEANGRDVVVGEYVEARAAASRRLHLGLRRRRARDAAGSSRVEVTLQPDGATAPA